jgi:hypothetical protein
MKAQMITAPVAYVPGVRLSFSPLWRPLKRWGMAFVEGIAALRARQAASSAHGYYAGLSVDAYSSHGHGASELRDMQALAARDR